MSHTYEIEIKSLLGSKENADKLIAKMKEKDRGLVEVGSHKQLNHYFILAPAGAGQASGGLRRLFENVKDLVQPEKAEKLREIAERAKNYSVRTRWADGKVILVVKASVDDTTSFNGTARLEWESQIQKTIEELDQILQDSGFAYQAKWSRERQEYIYHPGHREISVSIDKNAGYGHLAEFEVVVNDESKAGEVKTFIRETMADLEIEELPQDRLERMFAHYNAHWPEYYGTDNIFVIE